MNTSAPLFPNGFPTSGLTRRRFLQTTVGILSVAVLGALTPARAADGGTFDIVVIGGTPGGIAAAIAAARLGRSVALTEYHPHFGGMSASGLGKSDIENRDVVRGLFAEFVGRVEQHYRDRYGADSEDYRLCRDGYFYEPKVAERVFNEMLAEQKSISLFSNHQFVGVEKSGESVTTATVRDRASGALHRLDGKIFIDATYEGDLYAAAGAEFRLGREPRDEFGEPHAGHVYFDHRNVKFLPGGTGAGDRRLTAYTYRLCLTDDPANAHRLTSPPPEYDRRVYLGYLDDVRSGRFGNDVITARVPFTIARIPNRKTDVNMKPVPLGFVFVEENAGYVDADWTDRERISRRIRNLTLGLLWFLQNDPDIPAAHREYANTLHLPLDEFTDNGHFPFQLYVREARRLVGEYTLTEHDVTKAGGRGRTGRHDDAIAVGEFPIDSFPYRKKQPGDTVILEGYLGMLRSLTRLYQIPYRIMVPKKVDGLLVPVAASTTHVAFSTIRMEPTWMVLGQAAGVAAHVALEKSVPPRAVPISEVQALLRRQGQVIDLPDRESADP
ncbi:MAG TPA: FAD-dependent oxidoreductase [Planctomycetaceae bacterium]|nr:FAD-dependent oxidoreductase [Planctomycetaceae bacterium]